MDVQDPLPHMSFRTTPQCGKGEEEVDESEQDSSDGDAEFMRLTQQLADNPTEENEKKLRESEARLRKKARRVAKRKKELRAMLSAYKQKEKEFCNQMDRHMEEVESHENNLGNRIEELSAGNQELRESTERRGKENVESQERLMDTMKSCSESETRVQFLMERIVALLTASNADPALIDAVSESRKREKEVIRQIEEARGQFEEVRQQNGELTSRLTDEMGLSRRLSDQLAEVEERFFHHRPERLTQGDASALRAAGLLAPQLRIPDAPPDVPVAEEPLLPPLPGDRMHPADPGRRTPLVAVPEAEVPSGLDFDLDQERGSGMESIAEDPPSQVAAPLDHEEIGMRGTCREDQPQSRVSSRQLPPTQHAPPLPPPVNMELMESKLREALDKAAFERAVVRVESGVYDFGQMRAIVRLTSDNEVVASRQDGQNRFEPIDDFIRNVAKRSLVTEDQNAHGPVRPTPPSSTPPAVSGEPPQAMPMPEREAPRATSPPSMPTALLTGPGRSPRSHWPQAVPANASPPRGHTSATPPPQRNSSNGRNAQQPLGASLRSRQEAAATSTSLQARTGARSAPAVPPLQLHVASVMPLHSRTTASSTPERPRAGLPPPPVPPTSGLGAPLVSPRPQASMHKAATRQLASSPPRIVRGMATGPAPGAPARMAVTQSPRRQVATS